jgi:hypothetical protein
MIYNTLFMRGFYMPKKLLNTDTVPTLVRERLSTWGRCIHTQRLRQRITAADLCARMSISEATLRRMERGDPGTAAGAYLCTTDSGRDGRNNTCAGINPVVRHATS